MNTESHGSAGGTLRAGRGTKASQFPLTPALSPSAGEREAHRLAGGLSRGEPGGFTLIELLVVIGVIVILAGLSFPAMQAVTAAQARHRARAEMTFVESGIENYKTKLGYYPPDNTNNWFINPLYYELLGTTKDSTGFQTLDGSARMTNGSFATVFGPTPTVTGFMNCSAAGAGDDTPKAGKFLTGLKEGQYQTITNASRTPICTVLGVGIGGAITFGGVTGGDITPYGYSSSNPQHNTRTFDLWVDVVAGGKTNRISNWSTRPIYVYYTTIANSYP